MRAIFHILLVALVIGRAGIAHGQGDGGGISRPIVLPAYNPSRPTCDAPAGLRRALLFVQDNNRQFMQGAAAGFAAAARDRGLEFSLAQSDNDPRRMIEFVAKAHAAKTGAVVVAPINPTTLGPSLKSLIHDGTYVGSIVPPPAISILNAPQFRTGELLGETAGKYIAATLGGKARVVLLTHDSNQYLAQRFVAMRQVLKRLPGAVIIADISPVTVDKEGGYQTMKNIMIAHPNVDVVLGADTVVLGALAAVREAGRARPEQFFGGIDGEPEAMLELKKGSEYKVTISLASPVFAYAMGQHAADWLEGKSIPQGVEILPARITPENIGQYEADLADPAGVWLNELKRTAYLKMYGNICYDTRGQYLNFAWSSERH